MENLSIQDYFTRYAGASEGPPYTLTQATPAKLVSYAGRVIVALERNFRSIRGLVQAAKLAEACGGEAGVDAAFHLGRMLGAVEALGPVLADIGRGMKAEGLLEVIPTAGEAALDDPLEESLTMAKFMRKTPRRAAEVLLFQARKMSLHLAYNIALLRLLTKNSYSAEAAGVASLPSDDRAIRLVHLTSLAIGYFSEPKAV